MTTPQLSVGVLAVGADGYRALVTYGEIAPGSGNRGAILAVEQDGSTAGPTPAGRDRRGHR
ncbi:hypothetical protein FNH05_23470 [Amycolatopsis rhizosphaerae]|uniref:Uncharacterized protein n=1 Tax=Amycolatopsis rhizosphaerae TaxID=2053003 RepID=A0A558BU05_9PSEU|nr:hypothetical protein [Amycolatopsis rhizosphaerae]TVT39949.1 hypothetical protein FNH05_23470 [Amycolatopsis rhizosphaerae]